MPAPMSGEEVRRRFVEFFEERGHREVPSSSLVPHNDPTVLLTTRRHAADDALLPGAGEAARAAPGSVQKCFRTVDIDEVGDESHCTFFFMLGNFSVGDYFKQESLAWSWEFLTEVMGFPAERLYPTVHPGRRGRLRDLARRDRRAGGADRQARRQLVGPGRRHRPERTRLRDLFRSRPGAWLRRRRTARPGDGARYLEVWNNVFMEFFQAPDGSRTPLPTAERRHRHGSGAPGHGHAGRRSRSTTPISTRRSSSAPPSWPASPTASIRTIDRALRVIADHARGGDLPDLRRRAARQRGALLRPAPHPAPRDPRRPPAGLDEAVPGGDGGGRHRAVRAATIPSCASAAARSRRC